MGGQHSSRRKYMPIQITPLLFIDRSNLKAKTSGKCPSDTSCIKVLHPSAPEASDSEDEAEAPPPPPSQDDLDPKMFAPTGDVYSYFERRKIDPFFYANPLKYSTRNSLGGKYAKAFVF